jgi:hypothetical protein
MDEKNVELFDRYHLGLMSHEERVAFESQLHSDLEFRQSWDDFRMVVLASEIDGARELRDRLNKIHQEEFETSTQAELPRIGNARTWWWMAASFAAVIITVAILMSDKAVVTGQDLFAQELTPYPILVQHRSGGTSELNWQTFTDSYSQGKYEDAIAALQLVDTTEYPGYVVHFYRGVCLLLIQPPQSKVAIGEFDFVLKSTNQLHEQSNWYLALAHLQLGEYTMAVSRLKTLENGTFKTEEASDLLETLE